MRNIYLHFFLFAFLKVAISAVAMGDQGVPCPRDGVNNKKCIRMLRCVRKPCPHAAPHRIQTQLSSRCTASYISYKFPLASEKH